MTKKKFKVGMYGGKFMPFHKGHMHCVELAASQCEKLFVLLFFCGDQEIEILKNMPNEEWLTVESRLSHIENACKKFENVEVVAVDITECKYPDGTENWDMETQLVLDICGKLDAVYGSEPEYADYFHRAYPEATYVVIDKDRKEFPISGTKIRNMKNEEERKLWIV